MTRLDRFAWPVIVVLCVTPAIAQELATASPDSVGMSSERLTRLHRAVQLGSEGLFGWSGIYGTTFWVDPNEELLGVLMVQRYPGAGGLQQIFQAMTYQAIVGPPRPVYQIGRPGAAQQPAADVQTLFDRAISDFLSGRIAESVTGFDSVASLAPRSAPQLWQRGIALYYAGRYQDCREQFEAHRQVNPNDVENAAWHFLCVARSESAREARAALLPVGPDPRVPMSEIYAMFRDTLRPEGVVEAALAAAGERPAAMFYAHLYLGLYFEALGNQTRALEHITEAAADRYGRVGGYMHAVARVHLGILQRSQ